MDDPERLPERLGIVAKNVAPGGRLAGHDVQRSAIGAGTDTRAIECDRGREDVRESVSGDRRREVGVAAFDRPPGAEPLRIAQGSIQTAGVEGIASPRAANLDLKNAKSRSGLQPGDAKVRFERVLPCESGRIASERLDRRRDLQ